MALPGHRRTSSDKRRRSAHFGLKKKTLGTCTKCKAPTIPHRTCLNCGTYKGRVVIDTTRAMARTVARAKAKAPAAPVKEEKKEKKAKPATKKPVVKSSKAGSGSAGKTVAKKAPAKKAAAKPETKTSKT